MNADSYGFIFVFKFCQPIIFLLPHITSLLFRYHTSCCEVPRFGLDQNTQDFWAESLSVIGNIFLGQTSFLMIKAYLERMTKSEILLVMIGGMATVAGEVLAAYIGFLGGDDPMMRLEFAKHLLAASVMAAPVQL